MNLLRLHAWRVALVVSGVLLLVGGSMHPSSDAKDDLREELAVMTADDAWVPGHTMIALSTVLLAAALWTVLRRGAWGESLRRPLLVAAVAVSLYVVETVMHVLAVVDSDALAAGESAVVAWSHIGLSAVLYPGWGWALAYLAWHMGAAWQGWRRAIAGLAVVGGVLHAVSVPLVLLFPDAEVSPVFASSAMLVALWAALTGLVRAPGAAPVRAAVPASVG